MTSVFSAKLALTNCFIDWSKFVACFSERLMMGWRTEMSYSNHDMRNGWISCPTRRFSTDILSCYCVPRYLVPPGSFRISHALLQSAPAERITYLGTQVLLDKQPIMNRGKLAFFFFFFYFLIFFIFCISKYIDIHFSYWKVKSSEFTVGNIYLYL